jgi:hypothetical protein
MKKLKDIKVEIAWVKPTESPYGETFRRERLLSILADIYLRECSQSKQTTSQQDSNPDDLQGASSDDSSCQG